jgi:hypothetical protein
MFALCLLLVATLMTTLTVQPKPAHAQTTSNTLSIQAVYVTDSAEKPKTSFKSGDGINYHIDATNPSRQALSVSVQFFAYTIDNLREHIITDKTFSVNMPPGPSRFYTISVIPAGVTSGTYRLEGVIYQNSDRTNSSTVLGSGFSVTPISSYPLKVPFISQDTGEPSGNNLCGETSVAMVISYYADVMQYTAKPWQLVDDVATTLGFDKTTDTGMQDLANGLWQTHGLQIGSSSDELSSSKIKSLDQLVQTITTETQNGNPVIAFVNGNKYVSPRNYMGHWIVITGITGDTVHVNDPDDLPFHGKKIDTMSVETYKAAAMETAGIGPDRTPSYGLVVTGEQFHSFA